MHSYTGVRSWKVLLGLSDARQPSFSPVAQHMFEGCSSKAWVHTGPQTLTSTCVHTHTPLNLKCPSWPLVEVKRYSEHFSDENTKTQGRAEASPPGSQGEIWEEDPSPPIPSTSQEAKD